MQKLNPLVLRDFTGGMYSAGNDYTVPDSILKYTVNLSDDLPSNPLGSLSSRQGFTSYISDIFTSLSLTGTRGDYEFVKALHNYATNKLIFGLIKSSASQTYLYSSNSSTVSNIGGAPFNWYSAGKTVFSIVNFVGYVFATNVTYFKSWDKNTANNWGTTNLSSAPSNISLLCVFQGRLWAVKSGTSKVYFSSLPDISTNLITWDTTNNWIEFDPDDNDYIVGIKVVGSNLILFKKNSTIIFDGSSNITTGRFSVGAINNQSISVIDKKAYFPFLTVGGIEIYQMDSTGSYLKISEPINNLLEQSGNIGYWLENSSYGFLCSFVKGKKYYISFGPKVEYISSTYYDYNLIDDYSIPNIIFEYDTVKNKWSIISIDAPIGASGYGSSNNIVASCEMLSNNVDDDISATTIKEVPVFVGLNYGSSTTKYFTAHTFTYNKNYDSYPTSNNYRPINYILYTKKLGFGSFSKIKVINKFNAFVSGNYAGATVYMRVDGGEWKSIGGFTGFTTTFAPAVSGYAFELKVVGSTTKGSSTQRPNPFVFEGFEFFDVDIEDYES